MWEVGALITRQTAERPNVIWPSLEYVVGTALPEIGAVDQTLEVGPAAGPERTLEERRSYVRAFQVLAEQATVTVRRVLLGTVLGAFVGIGLGLMISLNRLTARVAYPTINTIRQVPLLALSILFLVWFGGTERGIYIYVAFGVSTLLLVGTINAVRNVPQVQVAYAQTLGAGRVRLMRTVILPAIVPELVGGIKVAVGLAWAMVLAAEYLGAQSGLGRLMLFFELFTFTGRMVVVLGVFVLGAIALHAAITIVGDRMTRWVPRT
jgi:ABC-type nitrate/sulfonate/bicarbonate transport system permease component